jgi:crossover junction endodeoxyribonuclease RuvC
MIGGCDIGLSGAIAKMDESGKLISLHDMPIMRVGDKNEINEDEVKELFAGLSHIFFEKAQAMPTERVNPVTGKTVKQGIASTAHYMASYGILRGIAKGMGIPYSLVHPATWKKAMMKDMPKEKSASIARVQQLFPGVGLTRKKDHGKADAALIALYGLNYILLGGR